MGEVWSAVHVTIHMRVAVKVLLARALHVPEIVARFEREAVLLGRTHGSHVPRIIDFFVDPTYGPLLVSELIEGRSLSSLIGSPLSVEDTVDLGIDLAAGLEELHRANVVHRDLKPGNVILQAAREGNRRAVIIDLGVSRLLDDQDDSSAEISITAADAVVGTVEYMAPEQILSCSEVTPRADIYALGALLYRVVAGVHAFAADLGRLELVRAKLTTEAPKLSIGRDDELARGLVAVVSRALQSEPRRRYQSAAEMRSDLLRLRVA
jgi:serine/threonine-protein kinase